MNIPVTTPISATLECITPQIAKAYLSTMQVNRRLNPDRVALYAKDIKEMRWDQTTGESIKFNHRGELIDGQHRLSAIVESNTPIFILVIRGCSDKSQSVIDSGQARSNAQSLQLTGIDVTVKETAIFRAMFLSVGDFRRRDISRAKVADLFPKYEDSIRFAVAKHGRHALSATHFRSLVARAHYCGENAERLARFLTVFDTGMADERTDAIVIQYRNFYMSNFGRGKNTQTKQEIAYSKGAFALSLFLSHSTSTRLNLAKEQLWKIKDFDGEGKE